MLSKGPEGGVERGQTCKGESAADIHAPGLHVHGHQLQGPHAPPPHGLQETLQHHQLHWRPQVTQSYGCMCVPVCRSVGNPGRGIMLQTYL